ncbi:hypothetical protein B0H12DRAFT_1076832 [Mycena haematopus]|nr:hypothetical protein B0H12DRAFT_1076832 [Mycena haematopus]
MTASFREHGILAIVHLIVWNGAVIKPYRGGLGRGDYTPSIRNTLHSVKFTTLALGDWNPKYTALGQIHYLGPPELGGPAVKNTLNDSTRTKAKLYKHLACKLGDWNPKYTALGQIHYLGPSHSVQLNAGLCSGDWNPKYTALGQIHYLGPSHSVQLNAGLCSGDWNPKYTALGQIHYLGPVTLLQLSHHHEFGISRFWGAKTANRDRPGRIKPGHHDQVSVVHGDKKCSPAERNADLSFELWESWDPSHGLGEGPRAQEDLSNPPSGTPFEMCAFARRTWEKLTLLESDARRQGIVKRESERSTCEMWTWASSALYPMYDPEFSLNSSRVVVHKVSALQARRRRSFRYNAGEWNGGDLLTYTVDTGREVEVVAARSGT